MSGTPQRSFDAAALDAILSAYAEEGVRWISLEDTLEDPAYDDRWPFPPIVAARSSNGASLVTTPHTRHFNGRPPASWRTCQGA